MPSINVATATAATSGGTPSCLSSNIMDIYSQEVLFAAQPILRFEAIAARKEELNIAPGLTIKFLRYANLTGGGQLTENSDMVTDAISSSQVPITVAEHGKAIAVSEMLLRSSFTDILSDSAMLLGRNLAMYRDAMIRDTILAGATNLKYANNRAGRTSLLATDYLDTDAIREVVETLSTRKAPKFGADAYVAFIHPHQARHLRTDPDWISAAHYGNPASVFVGEIGRFEDVRFIETTMCTVTDTDGDIISDSVDTGNDTDGDTPSVNTYQAIVVGDHSVGLAVSLEAELRDNGVKDFGRRHEFGWYGIWGAGMIEAGHALVLETA